MLRTSLIASDRDALFRLECPACRWRPEGVSRASVIDRLWAKRERNCPIGASSKETTTEGTPAKRRCPSQTKDMVLGSGTARFGEETSRHRHHALCLPWQ